jgi:hypothetical protein
MRVLTRATALLGLATVVVWAPVYSAAQTQEDFDACNAQATIKMVMSTPSASPRTAPGATSGGTTMPNASGGVSGSAGSPGTASGTTSGGTSGSASSRADAQLQGMASVGQNDEGYAQAYRDCMKGRGF